MQKLGVVRSIMKRFQGGIYDLVKAFDDFSKGFDLPAFSLTDQSSPHFDVKETSKAYKVTAKIPDMNEDDIKVSMKIRS